MAVGRMLRQKVTRSAALNNAINGIDAIMGFGHGAYAGILATWLIAFQDREGRVAADPGWLKTEIAPLLPAVTQPHLERYMTHLAEFGVFLYYQTPGGRFLQFEGFRRCNKIASTEPPSLAPDPTPATLIVRPMANVRQRTQFGLFGTDLPLPPGIEVNRSEVKEVNTVAPFGAPVRGSTSEAGSTPPHDAPPPTSATDSAPLPSAPPPISSTGSPPHLGGDQITRDASAGPEDAGSPTIPIASAGRTVGHGPSTTRDASPANPGSRRKEPLPFSPEDAWDALRSRAKSRFPDDPFPLALRVAYVGLIRQFPSLSDWELVADWLEAGGEAWRTRMDARQVTKAGNFECWRNDAVRWRDRGRPAITPDRPATRARPDGRVNGKGFAAQLARLESHG